MIVPIGELAVASLVAGAATIERKPFLQAMLSRPLVLGGLLGACLGDPLGGLLIGAPLELLFSGTANLGAILPLHETAATIAIVCAALSAGAAGNGLDGALAFLAVFFLAPVALLGRWLEAQGERVNERLGERVVLQIEGGAEIDAALRLHLTGLVGPFLAGAVLAAGSALVAGPILAQLRGVLPERLGASLGASWALFFAAGGACALRTARLPHSALFAGGAMVVAASAWLLLRGAR